MKIHIDYEARSRADIKKVGGYRYAQDRSTTILMAGVAKDDGPVHLWVNPQFCVPGVIESDVEAFVIMRDGCADPATEWNAWNAQFECAMSRERMLEDLGLVPPDAKQWRCVAAMSRRAAFPGKLETAAQHLGVTDKDKRGGGLINKFCKPMKDGSFRDPRAIEHHADFLAFCSYCKTDVVVEREIKNKLHVFSLVGDSLRIFQLDAVINDVGIPVNVAALHNAQRIIDEVESDLSKQFFDLTGLMPTQKMAVKGLLQQFGVDIDDMKGETLALAITAQEELLNELGMEGDHDTVAYVENNLQILRLYADLNFAATKKVTAMLACVCEDGRVRGTLLYHGAGTGRWAARLIQPQNFKKPSKRLEKLTHEIYKMICDGCTRAELEMVYGNALDAIASCIRHFIHWPGGKMFDADYAQIEARIVCWLAGQEDVLETFRKSDNWTGPKELKPDLYKDMASKIYSRPASAINNPSFERTVGKHAVLGCGFQMWWPKFMDTCEKFGVIVTKELAKQAVKAYREMCSKVTTLWTTTENAAKAAINNPGKSFLAGKLKFAVVTTGGIPFLVMTLPSKRNIVYPWPKLEWIKVARKDEDNEPILNDLGLQVYVQKQVITFFGQIEGKSIWGRCSTYGGKLVENATQGVAADVMGHGAANAVDIGIDLLTLIHDQALGQEHPIYDIKDFCKALTTLPSWAEGLPIRADGKVVPYYMKEAA